MAKRRRLETPGAEALAEIEAGFAAKPTPDRIGLGAPIAQIAGEIARAAEPLDVEKRVSNARDSVDAEAWRHANQQGRVISDLALDQIDPDYMMRDRIVVESAELEELKTSILAHGLRLPIEVVTLPDGRYGLVSGWRRVMVMRQLQQQDPDRWPAIKAIIRPPYEAGELYTAMVEENELRAQVTPYERGRIAVVAANLGAFPDTEIAIDTIFGAASKAKRSKIRSFAYVHDELGDILQFPTDLAERNGLRLAYALREGYAQQLRAALFGAKRGGPALEWALLEPIVAAAEAVERLPDPSRGGRPKTRFAKSTRDPEDLANGITMERVLHEDGYSIRLRGTVVDVAMVDQLMDQLRRWLSRLPE
ncbi:MAG: ParB N-terminal domain-containing protein [Pseudorhodobacter sp.]|nr:ParB N-terminal domain-containing protein [Pseudorhodobacter sp.]